MKIYTSYFAKVERITRKDIVTIGIAINPPDFYTGNNYRPLAPSHDLVTKFNNRQISRATYDKHYNTQLGNLDPNAVLYDLHKISGGRDITLLCYEKDPKDCHRSNVSHWLNKTLNLEVEEFYDSKDWEEFEKQKKEERARQAEKSQRKLF